MAEIRFKFLYTLDYTIKTLVEDFSTFVSLFRIRKVVIDRSSNYILDPIEQSLKQDLPWEGYRITVARDS